MLLHKPHLYEPESEVMPIGNTAGSLKKETRRGLNERMICLPAMKKLMKRIPDKVYRLMLWRLLLCCVFVSTTTVTHAQLITTIAGWKYGSGGFNGNGIPATDAALNAPHEVLVDKSGTVYFLDRDNFRIRKISTSGIISTIAGNGSLGYTGDGGMATSASFGYANGMAMDEVGNIYLGDDYHYHVARKISAAGIITTIAGNGTAGYSGDGGPATIAQLESVIDIAKDTAGNIYMCDFNNFCIRKVDKAGIITTIAGTGINGSTGDGGPATAARMYPYSVTTDISGNVFLYDLGSNAIRKINSAGIISTIAGVSMGGSLSDGIPATNARIHLSDFTIDRSGNIYLTDSGSRIRKINTAGIITTIAGNSTWGFAGDGGPATAAVFKYADGVAVDSAGNIYIADDGNNRIRKIFYNHVPYFTAGATQAIAVCENSGAYGLNSALAIRDTDAMQGEVWSILTAPAHGTAVVVDTAVSAGNVLTPTHTNYYTPAPGYSGNDTFSVTVWDSYATDTLTVFVTVMPMGAITGTTGICTGVSTTLSAPATGGTWSSIGTTVSVGTGSGIVTGVSKGTASITYTLNGCIATTTLTVSTAPAAITGAAAICTGTSAFLSNAVAGGTWSSASTNIAIGSSSGLVSGIAIGSFICTYRVGPGCEATWAMTVNATPAVITGAGSVCAGAAIPLSDATSGGTWSSGGSAASVGAGSGVVTGLAAGTATISYTLTGCTATKMITVNPQAAITGGSSVCVSATVALSNTVAGGMWSSSNTGVATVSAGTVSGVALGTTTITYALTTGCNTTKVITVSSTPVAITGAVSVCAGAMTPLSDTTGGGTWVSSNTAKATVDGMGMVNGVAAGTATISYSLGTGCTVTKAMSVYAAPMAITGAGSVCTGAMTQLTDATAGGSWSAAGSAASVGAGTGIVTGVSAGTATISYVMTSTGCAATTTVTVSNAPTAIAGNSTVCTANTITLTNAVSGGTWSSTGSAASVGTTNGIVTGVSVGTATITYSLGGGCITTKIIAVAPPLPAITGAATVCAGATTALGNATSGGVWTATGAVSVGAGSGIVSGIAAGTGTATYTVATTGCTTTKTITVNPLPGPIMGAGSVCAGAMITLSDAGSGTWSSAASAVSVGTGSGVVTGLSAGTAVVTYTLPVTGCNTIAMVQVYPIPMAIAGAGSVCAGAVVQLSDASVGGNWSAIVPGAVSVGTSTGVVTGMSAGTSTITYMTGPGCTATTIVTVNPNPAPITGAGSACAGDGVWLYDADGGGNWSATGGGVTILSTGYATTTIAGTSTIDYTFTTGCSVSKTLTVYARPDPITGVAGVCSGDTATVHDVTTGGIWSATGSTVSVGAGSGIVTGMSAGTATIVYTLLGTGCTVVRTFTVYPLPTAITGATAICMGSTGTLSNGIAGGTWSPALDTIMKLDAVTGDITGIKYGMTPITYTTANGCSATTTVTVHVVPNIYSMMGGGSYCAGDTGVHVLVAGSIIGTKYDLYNGATLVDTKMGTNKTLDFGLVTTPGTYTAIATQTITTCQSKMDTSATVVVNPLMPTAVGITPTPSDIVCAGTPVLYTAVPVNGGATPFYEWKVNGVSYGTGGTTYGYTPMKGDIVSLKMTSSVVCPSPLVIYGFLPMTVVDSIPPIVTITADPGVHVATGQSVTLTATVTNGITGLSYQWSVNGAAIAGATDNKYTESNPADHEVVSCAVMSNATCMTSDEESVELSIGAEGIAYPSNPSAPKGGLSVYPSPAKGSITIQTSLSNAIVSIYNVVGEGIWVGLTMTKNKETIDVSKFLPGVYLLQAVDGSTGLTMTKRFVKE